MRRVIKWPPFMERILKVVIQDQPRHNHLDLISRKKPPRTSIYAMTEVRVVLSRGRELMPVGLLGIFQGLAV